MAGIQQDEPTGVLGQFYAHRPSKRRKGAFQRGKRQRPTQLRTRRMDGMDRRRACRDSEAIMRLLLLSSRFVFVLPNPARRRRSAYQNGERGAFPWLHQASTRYNSIRQQQGGGVESRQKQPQAYQDVVAQVICDGRHAAPGPLAPPPQDVADYSATPSRHAGTASNRLNLV